MNLSLHALNPAASLGSNLSVTLPNPSPPPSKDVPAGSWSSPRQRLVASTPLPPSMPTKTTLLFMRQMRQGLESAAQSDNRPLMPAVLPRTLGWRSPVLHDLMSAGAPVLVPPGTAAPDSSIADMSNTTRTEFERYLAQRDDAFEGLTDEGREYARSAIVALLTNLKQPAGTPGRIEDSQIPVALRMIDNVARRMPSPGTPAPGTPATSTAATSPTAPPERRPLDKPHDALRAAVKVRELNARPGNEQGLLDMDSWKAIMAIEEPAVRRVAAQRAFNDYRVQLNAAYASHSWPEIDLKVLFALHRIPLAAAIESDAIDVTALEGWQQAEFQHRTITDVREYQNRIDRGMQLDGTPLSEQEITQLGTFILDDVDRLDRGEGVPNPDSPESTTMVTLALLQYERLLEQLGYGYDDPQ